MKQNPTRFNKILKNVINNIANVTILIRRVHVFYFIYMPKRRDVVPRSVTTSRNVTAPQEAFLLRFSGLLKFEDT